MRSREQAGFILVATLWIVAVLALIAATTTAAIEDGLQGGVSRRSEVEMFRLAQDGEATTLYWLATRYMSQRGLEIVSGTDLTAAQQRNVFSAPVAGVAVIALDDRPYRYGNGDIRLQDDDGLINVNGLNGGFWSSVLGRLGVAAEDRDPMVAKLHDYIDPGPLKSLNGAKQPEYAAAGLPAPAGAPLVTPWELHRVLDWNRLDSAGFGTSPIYENATAAPIVGFNFNTAPSLVLSALTALDDATVARIVAARTEQPFADVSQVDVASGASAPNPLLVTRFLPADSLRLTVVAPNVALERVIALRLTPLGEDRPWRIDYALDLPAFPDHRVGDNLDAPDFPDPAYISTTS